MSESDCTVSLAGLWPRPMTFPDLSGHETEWPWLLRSHMHIGPCRPVCEEAISMHRKRQVFQAAPVVWLHQRILFNEMLTTIQPAWDQCLVFYSCKQDQTPISGPWLTKAYMLAPLHILIWMHFWILKMHWFGRQTWLICSTMLEWKLDVLPIGRGFPTTLATKSHQGSWQVHQEFTD